MKAKLLNIDCMEYMRTVPDQYFDLAVVDPPYGIGVDGQKESTSKHGGRRAIAFKGWDNERPGREYFEELYRVSKNQIIWGANYFPEHLFPSMGWIIWDKGQRICNSDGELAYSSFDRATRIFTLNRAYIQEQGGGFHPTQKPIRLYKWLFEQYAKLGDKILDTHLGSGSSAIVAEKMGFEFVGCEIDKEYYEAAVKRVSEFTDLGLFQVPDEGGQGKPSQKTNTLFDAA